MATGWKEILLDVLKLTDEVKRLNAATETLSKRTLDMDKRLVRLETMVETAMAYHPKRRSRPNSRKPRKKASTPRNWTP